MKKIPALKKAHDDQDYRTKPACNSAVQTAIPQILSERTQALISNEKIYTLSQIRHYHPSHWSSDSPAQRKT